MNISCVMLICWKLLFLNKSSWFIDESKHILFIYFTTDVHNTCQTTFCKKWDNYIIEIYGKMRFNPCRIKSRWLIWIKFNPGSKLLTSLALVTNIVQTRSWHSKLMHQKKSQENYDYQIWCCKLHNCHENHFWASRQRMTGKYSTDIWC